MSNKIFFLSLALSFFLHSLLFVGLIDFSTSKSKIHYSENAGDALAKVRVQLRDRIIPKKQIEPKEEKSNKPNLKEPEIQEIDKQPNLEETSTVTSEEAIGRQSAIANYLTTLRSQIVKFQFKNRISQRLNLKGKVEVSFNISWPSKLEKLEVLTSSGNEALDQSAIESVQRIPQIPQMPLELEDSTIPVKVTLVYD